MILKFDIIILELCGALLVYVFNFHHVEPKPKQLIRKIITITPKGLQNFIRISRYLGIKFVSMREVLEAGGPDVLDKSSVKKLALITFDDGYVNNFIYAAPILKKEQCPATIFVLADYFSGSNDWDDDTIPLRERDQLMSLEQMKALAGDGWIEFGSHGLNHVHMTRLSDEDLSYEINQSYNIMLNYLGGSFLPVLAYPWGECTDQIKSFVKSSKYKYAFTTEPEEWTNKSNSFEAPRYSIYCRDKNPFILLLKLFRICFLPRLYS